MSHYIDIILKIFWGLDYLSIFFLMTLESSIFPVPAEAVMIPAWYLVMTWKLSFTFSILVWGLWSLFWAILNYFILGQLIWKPFLLKYWKYILIKEKDYHNAEKLFLKNDKLYTFLWRLIPVIRHIISIPAWIFKMEFISFSIITFLWASLWCTVLVIFWYFFWENIISLVENYTKTIWFFWILSVAWIVYYKIFRKKISIK